MYSHHIALGYAENILFRCIWRTDSNYEWCKCIHVHHFEIREKMHFLGKTMFAACFRLFELSICIDVNFLIIILGD